MKKFDSMLNGLVAPLDKVNVDTDLILPKQFLKSILRTGFGENLFYAWRYLERPEAEQGSLRCIPNPAFMLNQARYHGASILLGRRNFGCGSSREHATWALEQYGFRAIIAPSFADIFFNNCLNNGLLPIVLPEAQVDRLFNAVQASPGTRLTIDLKRQVVMGDCCHGHYNFDIDAERKVRLLEGVDDIDLTLRLADQIRTFEASHRAAHPWLGKSEIMP